MSTNSPQQSNTPESPVRRKVTVGVCGGIAAYKALDLVRALQQAGLDPHVVMTRAAEEFIRPLTFAALSGHKVITSLWPSPDSDATSSATAIEDSAIEHIAEAQTTQLLVIAPATADTLAKFAHGLADDFLSTLYLATTAPVVLAPAMNVNMWNHPATQANVATLAARGAVIVPPGSGYLACGMIGSGRLADTPEIVATVLATLEKQRADAPTHNRNDLKQETILVTAGGTREPIDPVRFLGNRSSGKMGYALATAALARGARVLLVSAPTALEPPAGCEFLPVTTAAEMRVAVLDCLPRATAVIGAAAVSDFRPATVAPEKLRRTGALTLELEPTPDILAEVASHRDATTLVIAFAAETESASTLENGRAKLERKRAHAIVVNNVSLPGIGFDADANAATILTATEQVDLPRMPKSAMADRILDQLIVLRSTSKRLDTSPAVRAD
ncbi:MAG TPA: bifunctional phosphopantothenoylcysteine decarboxylase/phosphopantothenate--cysteine ligase CoaBC [Granulicella sp.]|nr:bifunctional phosphopantothenoylcysteine decarboxylase/phosphopantothenate--cysteine ligase CoaBC [Granulicella sp.]